MSLHFFVKLLNKFRILLLTLTLCPVLAVYAESAGLDSEATTLVGEVSLVLGRAYREAADGSRQPVTAGTQVHVRDRLHTGSNGHIHVRFIDEALVSVRPGSSLEILTYDYSKRNPADSRVKFNLIEGVTRSISGDAASSAREKFRLNTPIAAIGVRGTDFVVRASEETVQALVNEGVIVMAPFSSDCSADTYGPCASNALELTQSTLQLLELDSETGTPRLLPAPHERDPASMREEVMLALDTVSNPSTDNQEAASSNEVYLEGITTSRVNAVAANVDDDSAGSPDTVFDFVPASRLSSAELTDRQLVWGRWSAGQEDLERITLTYEELRSGREVTVGNSDYVLFRPDLPSQPVEDGLGVVGFDLNTAQAFYQSDSGVAAMQVLGGDLQIDFNQQQFVTTLNMDHELTGLVDFQAQGSLFDGGFFHNRTDDQRIAGAVTLDGREAGYFFEKQLQEGGIHGLTLWGTP